MNFPDQFELFGNQFHYHFLFETLAFFVGIRVYYFLRKKSVDAISEMNRLWILLGAMLGALLGSRLIAILELEHFWRSYSLIELYQNKTVAGGFLGGLLGVELVKKIIGVRIASGDIYVFPIIIGLFIGRIGCFLMGIGENTFGIVTTFFTGMNLGDGKLRHPVALYEIVFLMVLFIFFVVLKNKNLENGDRFKIFMILYFLYRFLVEFIKPYYPIFLNLSSIQWSAMFIFVYYWRFYRSEERRVGKECSS